MVWGVIAAAGIGAASSFFGQKSANSAAQAASREQMAFQERMANTRYQRTMADMRAAGLNPMLAYQQGGGSVPAGATYQPGNVGAAAASGAAAAGSTAVSIRRNNAEVKNLTETNQLIKNQQHLVTAQQNKAIWERDILMENFHTARANAAASKIDESFYQTGFGKRLRQVRLVQENLGISLNAAAALLGYGAGRLGRAGYQPRRPGSPRKRGRNPRSRQPNWGESQIGPPRSKR